MALSVDLVIGVMSTAAHEQYRQELRACLHTWVKDAEKYNIKVVFLAGYCKSDEFSLVNLPNVQEDYQSAFYKQFYGIKYIQEQYNPVYQMIIGSDTYVNIDSLLNLIKNYTNISELYLGGHGDIRFLDNEAIYYHSGGPGFIINRAIINKLLEYGIDHICEEWPIICKRSNADNLLTACDVTMGYYAKRFNIEPIKHLGFYHCNHLGMAKSVKCCNSPSNIIIACDCMTTKDMDDYYNRNKSWTLVTAFFDLTKREPQMTQRDINFYLEKGQFALSLDHNMVIFCEKDLIL